MCWRCGATETLLQCKTVQLLWETVSVFTIQVNNLPPRYLPRGSADILSTQKLHTNVHSNFIHNHWTQLTAQVSINCWINCKQIMVHSYHEILPSNKRYRINATTSTHCKSIKLSRSCQIQKTMHCIIKFICHSRKGHVSRNTWVVARRWEGRRRGMVEVSGMMELFYCTTTVYICQSSLNHSHLKSEMYLM